MLVIFLSSCTLVTTGQLSAGVAKAGVSAATFSSFWSDWWWVFVKGWHVTEFAVLFLLVARCTRPGLAVLLACTYAAADEWHQTIVPGRGGRLTDVLIDCGGVLVGCALLSIWRSQTGAGASRSKSKVFLGAQSSTVER
jgi:hypothetical protein